MKTETRCGLAFLIISLALRSFFPSAYAVQALAAAAALLFLIVGIVADSAVKRSLLHKKP
jgi:hypothetical protein